MSATEDLSEETPSGRLKNNIVMSVNEYERDNTAEKIHLKLVEQTPRPSGQLASRQNRLS